MSESCDTGMDKPAAGMSSNESEQGETSHRSYSMIVGQANASCNAREEHGGSGEVTTHQVHFDHDRPTVGPVSIPSPAPRPLPGASSSNKANVLLEALGDTTRGSTNLAEAQFPRQKNPQMLFPATDIGTHEDAAKPRQPQITTHHDGASSVVAPSPSTNRRKRDCDGASPVNMILDVFSFLVYSDDVYQMQLVSKRWRELTSTPSLWQMLPDVLADGSVNWLNFRNLGTKNKGTEGRCYQCFQRSSGRLLAMKQVRVYPKGEGVSYCMLREFSVLRDIKHPNIVPLEMISLAKDKLHVFFPYVDKTLQDIINPTSDSNGGRILPEQQVRRFLHQLLDAVAHCHRRGVVHRNLKPKHLLIDTNSPDQIDTAELRVSDFALVRATGIPRRAYTMDVVTLWYRPPEILMGVRSYSPAVDIWSIGCIFAEMAQGKPLFTGISQTDQLFQIFSKLSTPTPETWPEFTSLPNYQVEFPKWTRQPWSRLFPSISDLGRDLLSKLLTYNPDDRISAETALRHPYFAGSHAFPMMLPSIPMVNMAFTLQRVYESEIPEHVALFHAYLRDAELALWRDITYLSRQDWMSPMPRSLLVDWIVEVVDVFELSLRTGFLAVLYTDRFLDTVMVNKKALQLLGATCLHVASKCEDVSYIGVADLSMCADNAYTSADVLKMEEQVLNTLNFALTVPTVLDFLNVFQKMMPPLPKKTAMLAQYLAELALQEYRFVRFLPSCVATSCLSLAMYCIEGTFMTTELQATSRYTCEGLKECLVELQDVHSSAHMSELKIVKKRYSGDDQCQVAQLLPPTTYIHHDASIATSSSN